MLLASFRKHPSRSTADHISKSVSCGMCGAVNDHIRLKAFGGWKFDRGTTQLRARILRGMVCAQEELKHVHWRKLNKRNFCPTSVNIYIYIFIYIL